MVKVAPFRAWRPAPDKVHLVGSRSYMTYGHEELTARLRSNPYSFLHIVHPDLGRDVHLSRSERFRRVKSRFREFCNNGIFLREKAPAFYLYEQRRDGLVSIGFIGAVSIQDYTEGRIKVHEQTLSAREALFVEYLEATGINAEPVLLASPDDEELEAEIARVSQRRPTNDFVTPDGHKHRLWVIDAEAEIALVRKAFARMDALYIADGHHRSSSSALLAGKHKAQGDDPMAWCLAFIVPRSHLHIYNFDRVVTDLGEMDLHGFLDALAKRGTLERLAERPKEQPGHGSVHLCVPGAWYTFSFATQDPGASPQEKLDPARLSSEVLGPVLGIEDLRTNDRVSFVPGILGIGELEDLVEQGRAAVAFHLRPVDYEELTAVADSGGIMPPKSTYIEPKLRSGITVYSLEDR